MARPLAIDLGTANTLVYMEGQGVVFREHSVIAVHEETGEVLAMGTDAWKMVGRTPSYIKAIRPLRHGAITDFDITARMLRSIFQKVGVNRFNRPKVVICIPSALTLVEIRAVKLAARRAGAGQVLLMEQPMAAALGASLPIDQPVGNLIVDIGGGTTEALLASTGGVVAIEAERVGSFSIDDAIYRHVREQYGVALGDQTTERIKITIGQALQSGESATMEVRGRRTAVSKPQILHLSSGEIHEAIRSPLRAIMNVIMNCVSEAPPELARDIAGRGLHLTGGGGLLRNLNQRIANETGVPVHMVENPLECVVMGAGRSLGSLDLMQGMLIDVDDNE